MQKNHRIREELAAGWWIFSQFNLARLTDLWARNILHAACRELEVWRLHGARVWATFISWKGSFCSKEHVTCFFLVLNFFRLSDWRCAERNGTSSKSTPRKTAGSTWSTWCCPPCYSWNGTGKKTKAKKLEGTHSNLILILLKTL